MNHTPAPKQDVTRLVDYIIETGLVPVDLPPEYAYASLPLCIIDAVFSIGVRYAGVTATIQRFCANTVWRVYGGDMANSGQGERAITDLLAILDGTKPENAAATLFGNRQRTSTRSGILKAEAVQRFARALLNAGINTFEDITQPRLESAKPVILTIPGQKSGISFDYFQMLAGNDGLIKPDRMVQRFVAKALEVTERDIPPARAVLLVQAAVLALNSQGHAWTPRGLDYVVWKRESDGA